MSKTHSTVDVALMEYFAREELNKTALRVMAVLDPVKVIIDNYPEEEEELEAQNNPEDPEAGTRLIPFSREVYIDRDDFREDPPRKYFRLSPGKEVRLKHAYYVTCVDVVKNAETGEIEEIHCTYDPATKGGWSDDGRKVRGTLHWVSSGHAIDARVRLFDRLFSRENVEEVEDFLPLLNPDSLIIVDDCKLEPGLAAASTDDRFQFLRQGYFARDPENTGDGRPVFNRIVALRDSWAKIEKKS